MQPIINVNNLGKQYVIGSDSGPNATTLRETLTTAFRAPLRQIRKGSNDRTNETIWALRDLSFQVTPGERLGIIGHNGAGKSTLLKILSRITDPTTGRAELFGRVGSLLEVGIGFHPELTGRENILFSGAMLGMKRKEIYQKFDEIVDFAEVERFIDTPVKRYSSGMYTRLAFAVAAHLEPEILIVDEVLAVGDVNFQKKCLGKMNQVAQEGRTVLFVSHNMTAIQALCNRVIWLDKGSVVADGAAATVATRYLQSTYLTLNQRLWNDALTAPGNDKVRLRSACARPLDESSQIDSITVRTPIALEFTYWNLVPGAHLNLSVGIYNDAGTPLFFTGPGNESDWHGTPLPKGLFRSICYIPANLLNDGTHRVHLLVIQDQSNAIFRLDDILIFDILDDAGVRSGWFGKWPGAVRPSLTWQTELVESEAEAQDA